MTKYVETQTRKIISAYGGIGSIFESTQGALLIEKFEKWGFVKKDLYKEEYYRIEDNRLINRLRYVKAFSQLTFLFQVPYATTKNCITARYFPEWFFCSNCNRFKKISDWLEKWKKVLVQHKEDNILDKFVPPRCADCFDTAKSKNERRKYYELQQIAFIMTSSNGEIRDIPWDRWPNAIKAGQQDSENNMGNEEQEDESKIQLNFKQSCCDKQDLRYKQNEKIESFRGIRIICEKCKKYNNLSGLFDLRIPVSNKNEYYFKPVIRSSNSVYYPILINSIYLPVKEIAQVDKNKIVNWIEKSKTIDFIYDALEEKYTKSELESYINNASNNQNEYISEIDYRIKEYLFILDNNNYNDESLIFTHQQLTEDYKKWGIENIVKISRLKMTTVQTGYTRQEPLDIDTFLNYEEDDKTLNYEADDKINKIKPQFTSSKGNKTDCLPAIESFGEGIFISFDNNKITQWIKNNVENRIDLKKRIESVFERSKRPDNKFFNNKLLDSMHTAKFILIHSFSHILIKELEFLCGYPAVSLKERLYIDNDNMQGVLIYTIAGSEGSYGGLINQAESKKLARVIDSALDRAKECSSDPVCYNATEQGIGGLNLAACYSCLLLPETSCEEFNCFLDRRLLIDIYNNDGF